jgi:hypothetical protein
MCEKEGELKIKLEKDRMRGPERKTENLNSFIKKNWIEKHKNGEGEAQRGRGGGGTREREIFKKII